MSTRHPSKPSKAKAQPPLVSQENQALQIEELRQARKKLGESELKIQKEQARLAAIINTAVDAIITIDEEGRIDSVNPASEQLFGYSSAELIGRNVNLLMPQPYRREHDGYLRSYLRTGIARIIGIGREVVGERKDGTTFPLTLAVSETRLGDRRMFTGIIHDLTSRRYLERQILEATASEQRRIGQDLHDGLCQELVSLSFGLELIARKLEMKGIAEFKAIQKLGDSLEAITNQARNLARGLNPVDVDAGGLPASLEQLAARIADSTGIRCDFHWDQRAQAQDGTVATHLFRIAQEAIGNAIKHGKPSRINLALCCENGTMTLTIEDNGSGVRSGHVRSIDSISTATRRLRPRAGESPSTGMGLQTMNYRARLIGGTFNIEPGRRGGTLITCSLRSNGTS